MIEIVSIEETSEMVKFAKKELAPLLNDKDPINVTMGNDILALVRVFAEQDHSGASGAYCLKMFNKLADMEPLNIDG